MIIKKYRLNFNQIRIGNFYQVFRGQYLAVKKAPNNLLFARLGVFINSRTSSKAIERNRLKRMVSGFYNQNHYFFKEKAGNDWLIFFLTSAEKIFNNKKAFYKELNYVLHL